MRVFDFVKGVGAGLVVGAAAGAVLTANNRRMRKSKHGAVRSIGEAVNSVTGILEF